MEIKEEVAMIKKFMIEKPLCKGNERDNLQGYLCRIGEQGKPGDLDEPTSKRLRANMKKAGVSLPNKPKKKYPTLKANWDLEKCDPNCFPQQYHHLIPKKHLPELDWICVWLAKNAANEHWKLIESTNYDTDDALNGMVLPFASTTYEWNQTKPPITQEVDQEKQKWVCYEMMWRTGKQLHQGSHTYEDFGEQDNLHNNEKTGYLGAVDELLKVVNGQILNHVLNCDDCNKSKSKPYEVPPLERVVQSIHQVSGIMASIITGYKRFVSNRSADYWRKMRGR